ncbi:CubicO group peptidase (beta-lactamase class C family) [Chryseobacterium ginsenosidimutans]|uniref:serine hydrolase n=1 Tax=Chryseobacterium ginsenosidimutans TaxID=687846 RepID=UPI00277D610D|nr:serine hydrolase [Chryseobacterium ginsenosidimutans]MDQ0593612.1 CubicO group peptidase (beta-lactamase class C family) [Chryseobacterium ginsenosidimutans]
MIHIFKKTLAAILLLFCTISVFAQTDSIDVFIQNQMQKRKIPGLELAIVRHGKIIKTGYYGLSNIQDSILVSHKTVFTINSITKAFVGVAILQLVEEGKLKLNAPISEYLTDIPETWKTVTVQQLLSHTSGIPDVVDEEESVMIADNFDLAWKKVIAMPNDFKAGEEFRYNQTNYFLLGEIINKLSGISFQEFITKGQLQKVGMGKTIRSGFGATKELVQNAANSYQFSKGKLNNMFFSFPPVLQTAAGMSSTATELANWIIALQNMELLKQQSSLQALWKPALLNNGQTGGFSRLLNGYAAGWPIIDRAEHPAFAPVGGGRSAVFVYPKDDLSIIVLTNLSGGSPDVFIDELAGLFIPDMKEANGFGMSPSAKSLKLILDKNGYKNAIESAKKLRSKNKNFTLTENEVNNWGYKLIAQKRMKDALELFKLNVSLYPSSANAFDSLGETYMELEENELALKNYEQSLKLNPQNKNAEQQIIRLRSKK